MSICPTEADERFNEFFSSVQEDFARLRAERDALAKDAARYQWLRTAYFSGKSAYTLVGPTRTAEELDTRIDAALAEEARTRSKA